MKNNYNIKLCKFQGGPDPPDPPLDPRMLNDMLQLPSGGLD